MVTKLGRITYPKMFETDEEGLRIISLIYSNFVPMSLSYFENEDGEVFVEAIGYSRAFRELSSEKMSSYYYPDYEIIFLEEDCVEFKEILDEISLSKIETKVEELLEFSKKTGVYLSDSDKNKIMNIILGKT